MDRIAYRAVNLAPGSRFCHDSAPNGPITPPTEGSSTQKRKDHRKRMEDAKQWDSKKTPAEDPNNPGYPPRKS